MEVLQDDRDKAEEKAGCAAFTFLLCSDKDGLPHVVFRPAHWKVPIADLVNDIGRLVDRSATFQPLPVHQRAAASGAKVEGGLENVPEDQKERAAELIRVCLRAHGGWFNPSRIDHKKVVQVAGKQETVDTQLAGLLPKGSLRQFIAQHPEFDVAAFDEHEQDKHWYVTWRSAASQPPPRPPPPQRPPPTGEDFPEVLAPDAFFAPPSSLWRAFCFCLPKRTNVRQYRDCLALAPSQ